MSQLISQLHEGNTQRISKNSKLRHQREKIDLWVRKLKVFSLRSWLTTTALLLFFFLIWTTKIYAIVIWTIENLSRIKLLKAPSSVCIRNRFIFAILVCMLNHKMFVLIFNLFVFGKASKISECIFFMLASRAFCHFRPVILCFFIYKPINALPKSRCELCKYSLWIEGLWKFWMFEPYHNGQ